MFGRDEKVVFGPPDGGAVHHSRRFSIFVAYGLWRLQVVQSEFYSAAAKRT